MADDQSKATTQPVQYRPEDVPAGWQPQNFQIQQTPPIPKGWQAAGTPPAPHVPAIPPTTIPKNYGFTPGNMYSNAIRGVGELGTGIYNIGNDVMNNPNWFTEKNGKVGTGQPGETSMLSKYITQPALREKMKAQTAPTGIESVGHSVAEAIPLIGPWVSNLAEQAGTGDIGGALARGGTQAGVIKGVQAAPGLVKSAGGAVLRGVGQGIADATPKAEPLGLNFRDFKNPSTMQSYAKSARAGDVPADVHAGNIAKLDRYVGQMPPVEIEQAPPGATPASIIGGMKQRGGTPKTPAELGLVPKSSPPPIDVQRANVRVTPTGLTTKMGDVQVEEVGGARTGDTMKTTQKPASSEEVNSAATSEIAKHTEEAMKTQPAHIRSLYHMFGRPSNMVDFIEKPGSQQVLGLMRNLTNDQFREFAKDQGADVEGKDFSRKGGKEFSSDKGTVTEYLFNTRSPRSLLNALKKYQGQ